MVLLMCCGSMGVGRRVTLVVTWWKASSQDSQLDNGRTEGAREADNGGAWLWEVAPRARCPQLIGCVNAPQWIHNFPRYTVAYLVQSMPWSCMG